MPKPRLGSARRTGGARTTKTRQPAAKRRKKSDAQGSLASSSDVREPVSRGPCLSASSSSSSSSSEDEFDSLVKNWNGEIVSGENTEEDNSRTVGKRKRTKIEK